MEDEIKRADEQIPDLKPDEGSTEGLIPDINFRPEESVSCCGTRAVRGGKLHTYDWLEDLPTPPNASDLVEVQFKNTRKAYYRNSTGIALKKGDIVAVESSPGHDIGEVTLLGRLVYLQMHKNQINPANYEFKRIFRIARQTDLEKWEEAKSLEHQTMLESRQIAQDLNLDMKIGDVEYQGDRTKAIFYYIADERVDFRELIKVLADRFHVRIEMRQIGARQEAGRIGGIGPCGREMCCASWMTSFVSVSTHSARIQDLSLNPVKLAGQCGKLKCCLNFELSTYLDAIKNFPPTDKPLETGEGTFYFFKYDIFKRLMWYSPQKDSPVNIVAVDADHVVEIQRMNDEGQKPDTLGSKEKSVANDEGFSNVLELDEDLTRFDGKDNRRNNRNGHNRPDNRPDNRRSNDRNDRRNDNRPPRRPDNRPSDDQNADYQSQDSANNQPRPDRNNDRSNDRNNNRNNANRQQGRNRFNDNRPRAPRNDRNPRSEDYDRQDAQQRPDGQQRPNNQNRRDYQRGPRQQNDRQQNRQWQQQRQSQQNQQPQQDQQQQQKNEE